MNKSLLYLGAIFKEIKNLDYWNTSLFKAILSLKKIFGLGDPIFSANGFIFLGTWTS